MSDRCSCYHAPVSSPGRYLLPLLAISAFVAGCVPSNPSETVPDGGVRATSPPTGAKPKDTQPTNTKPRNTAPRAANSASRPPPGPVIASVFEDDFERTAIGADWFRLGNAWKIRDGQLCAEGARNKGIWLRQRLPTNARIEFEAVSDSPDGDIKAEFWGDGVSGATSASYTNATSYLTIFGGWKNTFHVLARIDEHAKNRLEVRIDPESTDGREQPVVAGRIYAFRVERQDGKTISWFVDGHLMHRLEDPEPLVGEGHEHFGFNNWDVPICFDNLKITPL